MLCGSSSLWLTTHTLCLSLPHLTHSHKHCQPHQTLTYKLYTSLAHDTHRHIRILSSLPYQTPTYSLYTSLAHDTRRHTHIHLQPASIHTHKHSLLHLIPANGKHTVFICLTSRPQTQSASPQTNTTFLTIHTLRYTLTLLH